MTNSANNYARKSRAAKISGESGFIKVRASTGGWDGYATFHIRGIPVVLLEQTRRNLSLIRVRKDVTRSM